ncbi:ribbon-helix-helix protein, CopG family [Microcoleus sp. FACHB-1]|nr:ribbon-helix-helix protein, CopG family [Microcoleus sp. FACHB-1]
MRKRTVTLTLSESQDQQLEELAKAFCSSRSAVMRLALNRLAASESRKQPLKQRLSPTMRSGRAA